jgi:predicted dehydrogenase
MTAIRWAILGTGRMAGSFAADLALLPDAMLAAVGSRSAEQAARFAAQYRAPATGTYAEVTARDDIDAVYIATPHALHCEHALLCLAAGKPVLLEKPFTINAAEARNVIDAARGQGLALMEAMWTRFVPSVVRLRELLAGRVIGDVQLMVAGGAFMPARDPQYYLFNRELGGGVLLDAGVYLVSYASMIFGAPAGVAALARIGDTGVDEHDAVLLEHPGGALANLYVSLRARCSPDLRLYGDRGSIHVHAPLFAPRRITVTRTGESEQLLEFPFDGTGYRFQAAEFNDLLRAGRMESRVMPLDETLRIMRTLDEIRAQIGMRYPCES